jgi:gamma-glutamylputrescine oxidase
MALNLLHANDRRGEYPPSWYAATVEQPPAAPPLAGEIRADVCIVGAGYTGLSAALHLAKAGFRTVILEAHRAGWGASGRNGGQAGTGQRRGQDELEEMLGRDQARKLWNLAEESKALVRSLVEAHGIDCELMPGVIHADHKPAFVDHTKAYVEKLSREYGYRHARFLDRSQIRSIVASDGYFGGAMDDGAFHLHPLKYVQGLRKAAQDCGAILHENSEVLRLEEGDPALVRTSHGSVRANHVILACNGYLGSLEPRTARKVMPINNYIIATEPLGEDRARELIANNAAVADSRFVVNYFRLTPDTRLLFGGGENYGYRFPQNIPEFVRKPMLKVFPQLRDVRIDYGWGGTLAITTRRMPSLMRLGRNMLSASGYSGQGVTHATLCGKLCAEAIMGQAERFDTLASIPQLAFPGGDLLRHPLLVLAMSWYALRDRL